MPLGHLSAITFIASLNTFLPYSFTKSSLTPKSPINLSVLIFKFSANVSVKSSPVISKAAAFSAVSTNGPQTALDASDTSYSDNPKYCATPDMVSKFSGVKLLSPCAKYSASSVLYRRCRSVGVAKPLALLALVGSRYLLAKSAIWPCCSKLNTASLIFKACSNVVMTCFLLPTLRKLVDSSSGLPKVCTTRLSKSGIMPSLLKHKSCCFRSTLTQASAAVSGCSTTVSNAAPSVC
mmetsp:Transcript_17328/g.21608  ORF Transcript_17328/g.21608 Transcript_17328/m.21608 type:complete len:236 (+) Transcript_17328:1511-2218(+)